MNAPALLFFGSTTDSVTIANALTGHGYTPRAVITQPPRPVGRKQILTKTPVQLWAEERDIPVISFESDADKPWLFADEEAVVNTLSTYKPDLLISASYGQKIPIRSIQTATFGGINVHPSLLPRWRGADPVPWTIISGDQQTGVSVVTLSERFDLGSIIAQKKCIVPETESADPLRARLFELGAQLLLDTIPMVLNGSAEPVRENSSHEPYARKLKREDGFIPWPLLEAASAGKDIPREEREGLIQTITDPLPIALARMARALIPWPGVWTTVEDPASGYFGKRLKVLETALVHGVCSIQTVQPEGKQPMTWEQFRSVANVSA